jgi:hypothetical protein
VARAGTLPAATVIEVDRHVDSNGIALAEAPARKRKQIRNELQTAIHQLMAGLRAPAK